MTGSRLLPSEMKLGITRGKKKNTLSSQNDEKGMKGKLIPGNLFIIPGRRFEFSLQAQVTSGRIEVHRFLGFSALQLKGDTLFSEQVSKHQCRADQRQVKA